MTFAKYVSEQTTILGGFNYWEPSMLFNMGNLFCTLYLGNLKRQNLNIVVIEAKRHRKDGRERGDWYFGTIKSDSGEIDDAKYRMVQDIIRRKNRIACRELEAEIHEVIDPLI